MVKGRRRKYVVRQIWVSADNHETQVDRVAAVQCCQLVSNPNVAIGETTGRIGAGDLQISRTADDVVNVGQAGLVRRIVEVSEIVGVAEIKNSIEHPIR